MTINLYDTFNDRKISSHRKLVNAVIAKRKHLASIRASSPNSYLTYAYRYDDGSPVDGHEIMEVEEQLDVRK
jgi:hypothetical protein